MPPPVPLRVAVKRALTGIARTIHPDRFHGAGEARLRAANTDALARLHELFAPVVAGCGAASSAAADHAHLRRADEAMRKSWTAPLNLAVCPWAGDHHARALDQTSPTTTLVHVFAPPSASSIYKSTVPSIGVRTERGSNVHSAQTSSMQRRSGGRLALPNDLAHVRAAASSLLELCDRIGVEVGTVERRVLSRFADGGRATAAASTAQGEAPRPPHHTGFGSRANGFAAPAQRDAARQIAMMRGSALFRGGVADAHRLRAAKFGASGRGGDTFTHALAQNVRFHPSVAGPQRDAFLRMLSNEDAAAVLEGRESRVTSWVGLSLNKQTRPPIFLWDRLDNDGSYARTAGVCVVPWDADPALLRSAIRAWAANVKHAEAEDKRGVK